MNRGSRGVCTGDKSAAEGFDDRFLVLAVQRRDESAFEALYRRHASAVFAVTVRELGDADLAGELTQLAFIRLWERAATIRVESRVRAWLIMVAHNAAIDVARQRRNTTTLEAAPVTISPDRADDGALKAQRSTAVRAALDTLPAEQRQAVEMAYFGGLTQTEIAQILREPLGTVKGRIRLAMRKLRSALGPFQEEFA
jgi:RNA polymerase sigma-70 factor (ECF subfamily)